MSDSTAQVVIVGSGSAGFAAALAAKEAGLEPLILESTGKLGGSAAMSGGGAWIPNNRLMRQAGVHDSLEDARKYMDLTIGDVGPASSPERRETFLREGPRLVEWLESLGFRFHTKKVTRITILNCRAAAATVVWWIRSRLI